MPGTRTAPAIDGIAFTYKKVSLHWMDYTGEKRADSYKFDPAATAAEIEAFAAASQALSNATLWQVTVADVYSSVEDADNAVEAVWEEASANVTVQTKNASGQSIRTFIPAPVDTMFVEGTETPDITVVAFGSTYVAALQALLPAGYSIVGARFTSRRDINQQIKI